MMKMVIKAMADDAIIPRHLVLKKPLPHLNRRVTRQPSPITGIESRLFHEMQ
ncbi:MAG: hypothetical protein OXD33_02975 [Rhodobacteraceae bacterium]|nr:hypothetical protein [Paracoccaceae bacterium]